VPVLFQRGTSHFRELWFQTLDAEERIVIQQILNGDLHQPEMQPILNRLIRKEVLELTPSGYEFQVPLIRRYAEKMMRNG
jgi:hypothetical protein